VLQSGRFPVLVGDSGVGKTAAVYEYIARNVESFQTKKILQLFDKGCFCNGAGETVSCRSMIVIATSNAGAEVYRKDFLGFTTGLDFAQIDREIDQELFRRFRFEFLNRFDQIVHFHPLKREHIRVIALREFERLKHRIGIRQRGFVVDCDESVVDWLALNGFDPDYGARFLRRVMEKNVSTAIADYIVRFAPAKGSAHPAHGAEQPDRRPGRGGRAGGEGEGRARAVAAL
jgi:ATP-dependent Clp protease ATP-binding subunit ClpA